MLNKKKNKSVSRRDFICSLAKYTAGLSLAPAAFKLFCAGSSTLFASESIQSVPVRFFKRLENKAVQCLVCPFNCRLQNNQTSRCFTKINLDGKLVSTAYKNPCIVSVDPIEKMPFHHFLPGKQTFTAATGGCNLHCLYCQNWEHSQKRPEELRIVSHLCNKAAASSLKSRNLKIMAFNYTESVMMMEWIKVLSEALRPQGFKIVAGTALYINPQPLNYLIKSLDAIAVTLKGFTEEFYQNTTNASLKPVLDNLIRVKESGIHLEVINLLIPTHNDSDNEIKSLCKWLVNNLGAETPLHFTRFEPVYKMQNLPRTPLETLERAHSIALESGIKYAYIGNLAPHRANDTYCSYCQKNLIKRVGHRILDNVIVNGSCPECKQKIFGTWS